MMDETEANGYCGTSSRTNSRVRLLGVIKLATWKPTEYNYFIHGNHSPGRISLTVHVWCQNPQQIVLDSIRTLVLNNHKRPKLMIRGIDQLLMIYSWFSRDVRKKKT